MHSFRTELTVFPQPIKHTQQSKFITVGSCFAEVMGQKLQEYKIDSLINPFGTIFNPLSVFKLLQAALEPQPTFTGELVYRDEHWYAYDLHSSFTASSQISLIQNINKQLTQTQHFLKTADCLILTLGTAVAYIHKVSQTVVANCHKIPQQNFTKKLLSFSEITEAFDIFYTALIKLNPNIRVILTVSPVRHLKETLELNSVSKSILRVACHEIAQNYATRISYFPAYELILDDLRDYRFYKPDMLHPDEVAEKYIWQKFSMAYFDQNFLDFTAEWDKIKAALNHKSFNPGTPAHQNFLKNTLAKLKALSQTVNCQPEIEAVQNQLKS